MKDNHLKETAVKRAAEYREMAGEDPYRLHFHLMPPVGLMNDPNGLVFFQGKYHFFYQWNPFETAHGVKFWGHYVSDNLVYWEEAPVALAPDQWYDRNGCYSGSAVVHEDQMYIFYTGNVRNDAGERESYQCMAVSEDGVQFDKKGPVINVPDGYTAHFRDPKVFKKGPRWYMVVGAQTVEEKGEVVLFSSDDLETWSFQGTLAGSDRSGLGSFGYMWECPDFFELNGEDILLVSPQGLEPNGILYNNVYQSGYFAGKADLERVSYPHGGFTELDRGFDFYAPQTMLDGNGRRLLVGWMGSADEGSTSHPTTHHGWVHAMTIPRVLEWENGRLLQQPAEELKQLRGNNREYRDVLVTDQQSFELPSSRDNVFELQVQVKSWDAASFSLTIGTNNQLIYREATKTFTLERANFEKPNVVERRHCALDELKEIRVFKDTSSLEIFLNGGEEVFTARVYDEAYDQLVSFHAEGDLKMDVAKWDLGRILL
ncbi:glycoside hydrolase family 32 protein [Lentibacillus sediminis]|uniref:glycoside hydrolase family 32 protein n=1 Tax=Lentibacillus sediminis TaxID=1940529 RepID=UPI000C1BA877|nr:glycoside hydrolase family 32 protein [Lentibacillus sediminis]